MNDTMELRWLLLGIGALLIALVYFFGIRRQIKEQWENRRRRRSAKEPAFDFDKVDKVDQGSGDTPKPDNVVTEAVPPLELKSDVAAVLESNLPELVVAEISAENDQPKDSREPVAESILEVAEPVVETLPGEELPDPVEKTEDPNVVVHADDACDTDIIEDTGDETEKSDQPGVTVSDKSKKTVVLTVLAPPGHIFRGPSIMKVAEELRLTLQENGLYDYLLPAEYDHGALCSIAHLRNPGTFEEYSLRTLRTPGLLLFMQLPGPMAPRDAMERLLVVARELAWKLGGAVADEKRRRLMAQDFADLRRQAAEFENQRRSAGEAQAANA